MMTVNFWRIFTKQIQTFDNVVIVVAQLQGTDKAHYLIKKLVLSEDRKTRIIEEHKVPMNDAYINSVVD